MSFISKFYKKTVLCHPIIVLAVLLLSFMFFSFYAKNFKLDASPDTLLLEDDKDLKLFREISERYNIRVFLVVTFAPYDDLFSKGALTLLSQLRDELKDVDSVDSIVSIVDIPLLETSDVTLSEITSVKIKTLEDPDIDIERAKKEIMQSPIYKDLLLGSDGQTTAILINLKTDAYFTELLKKRDNLLSKKRSSGLSRNEQTQLKKCLVEYEEYNVKFSSQRHQNIRTIRSIIKPYEKHGVLYLGGLPMIVDDMILFIQNDLMIFGFGVFIFIVATLTIIFRDIRWVVLPVICCFYAVLIMIGVLGFLNWKVTVISSNFISLMLILTMSMNIHLAVRYRQLCAEMSDGTQLDVVFATVRKMVLPCLYAGLTTILAFSSLVFSGIKPVIDFGWMMTIGLTVTFITSFLLLPSVLLLLNKTVPLHGGSSHSVITSFFGFTVTMTYL